MIYKTSARLRYLQIQFSSIKSMRQKLPGRTIPRTGTWMKKMRWIQAPRPQTQKQTITMCSRTVWARSLLNRDPLIALLHSIWSNLDSSRRDYCQYKRRSKEDPLWEKTMGARCGSWRLYRLGEQRNQKKQLFSNKWRKKWKTSNPFSLTTA